MVIMKMSLLLEVYVMQQFQYYKEILRYLSCYKIFSWIIYSLIDLFFKMV